MPVYHAVVDQQTGKVLYAGTDTYKTAVALAPGTEVGYANDSCAHAIALAQQRASQWRERHGLEAIEP